MIENAICLTMIDKPLIVEQLKDLTQVQLFKVGVDHIDEQVNYPRPQIWNYWQCIKKIVAQAKENKLARFAFFEQDAVVTPKFSGLWPIIKREAEGIGFFPDLFFLGSNNMNCQVVPVTNHIVRGSYTLDYHAVVINWSIYDLILGLEPSPVITFDGRMADYQRKGFFVALSCSPSIITQQPGFSSNENRVVDRSINHNI